MTLYEVANSVSRDKWRHLVLNGLVHRKVLLWLDIYEHYLHHSGGRDDNIMLRYARTAQRFKLSEMHIRRVVGMMTREVKQ